MSKPAAILDKKLENDTKLSADQNKLHEIVKTGSVAQARQLIKLGFNVNERDAEGHNALWHACTVLKKKQEEMIDFLLDQGATVLQNILEQEKKGLEKFTVNTAIQPWLEIQKTKASSYNISMESSWHRVFEKIKKSAKEEAHAFMYNQKKSVRVNVLANGSLQFFIMHVTKENIVEKYIEQLKEQKDKRTTVYGSLWGSELQLNRFQGQLTLPDLQKKPYRVPPIIFFSPHTEDSTFNLIVRNLPFFRRMGYSKFCFEFDANIDIDSNIKNTQSLLAKNNASHPANKQLEIDAKFFPKIKAESEWLAYHGIDLPLLVLGLREKLYDAEYDNAKKLELVNKLQKPRDSFMAEMINFLTEAAGGGTITVLGNGHITLMSHLIMLAPQRAHDFQLYHCFSSKTSKWNDYVTAIHLNGESQIGGSLAASPHNTGFTVKPLDEDAEGGIPAMDKAFQMNILSQITEPSYKAYFDSEKETEQTQFSILKQMFKKPFVGGIHSDNDKVDALLYVKSKADYEEIETIINSKINLVVPMMLNKTNKANQSKGKYVLIIPNIYSDNAQAIYQAYMQHQVYMQHMSPSLSGSNTAASVSSNTTAICKK